MSDYPKLAAEMGDRYLAALAVRQESFLKYAAAARKLVGPRAMMPTAATAIAATQALNEAQFEFASKLLDQQKQFFDLLLSQPSHTAMPKATTSPAVKRARTTTKAPVKKAASKKKTSAKRTSSKRRPATARSPSGSTTS